jgi:hypothetical protein
VPYRSLPQDAPEDPRLVLELAALANAAVARRRRVSVAVTGVVAGGLLTLVAAFGASSPPPRLACHKVEIRWENAPEAPPSSWTSCTTR